MNRIRALSVCLMLLAAATAGAGALSGSSYFRNRGPLVEPPYVTQGAIGPTNQRPALAPYNGAATIAKGQSDGQRTIISGNDSALSNPGGSRSPYRYLDARTQAQRFPTTYLSTPGSSLDALSRRNLPLGMETPGNMAVYSATPQSLPDTLQRRRAPLGMETPGGMTSYGR